MNNFDLMTNVNVDKRMFSLIFLLFFHQIFTRCPQRRSYDHHRNKWRKDQK